MKIPAAKAAVNKACEKLEKIPVWDEKKLKSKSDVIRQAKREANKSTSRTWWTSVTWRTPNTQNTSTSTKGELEFQEDNVKDEEGASASQMAARFSDTMSNFPGMAGDTSDAVSAFSQVKMTEASRSLRLPKRGCPEIWIRTPPRQRPQSWDKIDDPVVPLGKNICRWSAIWKEMGTSTNVGMLVRARKARTTPTCSRGRLKHGCKGMHAKRSKGWFQVQSKTELFKKLTTTREADEKDQTKENIRWKRSLLGAMIWKVMPKSAWRDTVN